MDDFKTVKKEQEGASRGVTGGQMKVKGGNDKEAEAKGKEKYGLKVGATAREASEQSIATGSKESQISQVQQRICFRSNSTKGSK
jgi:hypothetical protein